MKRQAADATPVADISDTLRITPLGAGNEVGRSCHLLQYKNKSILLDCGLHPAHTGISALPYLDYASLDTVDLCLITHFHLDQYSSRISSNS